MLINMSEKLKRTLNKKNKKVVYLWKLLVSLILCQLAGIIGSLYYGRPFDA